MKDVFPLTLRIVIFIRLTESYLKIKILNLKIFSESEVRILLKRKL